MIDETKTNGDHTLTAKNRQLLSRVPLLALRATVAGRRKVVINHTLTDLALRRSLQ